jgi:hypothetical protein
MTQATPSESTATQPPKNKINGQTKAGGQAKTSEQAKPGEQTRQGRGISDPREVAQLVMMRVDQVNSTKDELTTAVKALADTAKQLAGAYASQQAQIVKLAKRVEELEKSGSK